jgi:N-acetylglutamate synthase-like GNAT family acetyltransferase
MAMRVVVDNGPLDFARGEPARKRKTSSQRRTKTAAAISLRAAVTADALALHTLIAAHLEEGKLLPRTLDELTVHAPRFVVAVESSSAGERIVGCAELAPLSAGVAEVRSLVVNKDVRRLGLGEQMVDALATRARREGYLKLCACPLFRNCGQYAIVLDLDGSTGVLTEVRTRVRTGVRTSV